MRLVNIGYVCIRNCFKLLAIRVAFFVALYSSGTTTKNAGEWSVRETMGHFMDFTIKIGSNAFKMLCLRLY